MLDLYTGARINELAQLRPEDISNSDKRITVAPVAIVTSEMSAHAISAGDTIRASSPPRWDSTRNKMVIAVMRHRAAFGGNFQVKFFIAHANIEIVGGQPAADVIEGLLGKTQSIVSAAEAEAIRIGIMIMMARWRRANIGADLA